MKYLLLAVAAIAASVLLIVSVPVNIEKPKDLPPRDVSDSCEPSVSSNKVADLTPNSPSRPNRRIGQRQLDFRSSELAEKSVLNSSENASNNERTRRRSRRDAKDDFSSSVDKMSKISRVINGIALQQGLTKGSIQSDTLISELLNIGPVTTSSVQNLNPDALKQLVVDIQELPSKLGTNPNIERIEQRFLLYGNVLELTKGISSTPKIEKQSEYLSAVETLKDVTYDGSVLTEPLENLKTLLTNMKKLELDDKSSTTTTVNSFLLASNAAGVVKKLDGFEAVLKDELLRDAENMFGSVRKVNEAVEILQKDGLTASYIPNDDPFMNSTKDSVDLIVSISKRSQSSLDSMEKLYQLFVTSRHVSRNRLLTLTSGLPNGDSDLESISDDLQDDWVQTAVDGQSEAIEKALEPLLALKIEFQTVAELLNNVDANLLTATLDKAVKLSSYSDVFNEFSKGIMDVKIKKSMAEMAPTNRLAFQPLITDIFVLSKQLNAINTVVNVCSKLTSENAGDVTNIRNIMSNPASSTAPTQLDLLQKSPSFKNVLKLVKNAEESITILSTAAVSVTSVAQQVFHNSAQLTPWLGELDTFFTAVNLLSEVTGIEKLGKSIETIHELRSSPFKGGNFDKIFESVDAVKTSLSGIQNSIAGMTNGNLDSQFVSGDVLKDSQTVGSATRVFRSMEMMPENPAVVLDQSLVKEIQNQMKEMDSDDQKTLKQLLDLDSQLTAVYGQVDGVKKAVTSSSPTSDLSSLHPILKLAETAPGTPINFLEIAKSIEKLSMDPKLTLTPELQKAIPEILEKLEALDSIGLDFARHHSAIGESKKALEQLDVFFSSLKTKLTPTVATPPPNAPITPAPLISRGSLSSTPSSGASGETEKENSDEGIWIVEHPVISTIIGLFVFGVIAFIIFAYFKWFHKGKKANKKHPDDESDSLSDDTEAGNKKKKEKKDRKKRKTVSKSSEESDGSKVSLPEKKNPEKKKQPEEKKLEKTPEILKTTKAEKLEEKKFELTEEQERNLVAWQLQEDKTQPMEIAVVNDVTLLMHCLEVFLINISFVINTSKKLLPKTIKFSKSQGMAKYFSEQYNPMDLETRVEKSISVEKMARFHTHNIAFERTTRMKLTYPDFFEKGAQYHGNRIHFANNFELVLMQGPQDEAMSDSTHTRENTVGMFYDLVVGQKAQFVVCLTKFFEGKEKKCSDYIPFNKGNEKKLLDGKLVVKCLSKITKHGGELVIRELSVKFDEKPEHKFTHIHYLGWPDHGVPKDTKVLIERLNLIRKDINPVFIHCSVGIGRSGVIGLVFQCRVLLEAKNGNFLMSDGFKFIRESRYLAVQTAEQYAFAFFLFIDWVASDINVKQMTPQAQKYYKSFVDVKKFILEKGFDAVLADLEKKSKGLVNLEENNEEAVKETKKDIDALVIAEGRLNKYKETKIEKKKKKEPTLDKTMSNTSVTRDTEKSTDGTELRLTGSDILRVDDVNVYPDLPNGNPDGPSISQMGSQNKEEEKKSARSKPSKESKSKESHQKSQRKNNKK